MKTYPSSSASTDVVGQASNVVWVTHENGGLYGGEGSSGQCGAGTAAEGVVHDLPALN